MRLPAIEIVRVPRGPLTRAVPVIGSTVLPVFFSAIAIVRLARLPVNAGAAEP